MSGFSDNFHFAGYNEVVRRRAMMRAERIRHFICNTLMKEPSTMLWVPKFPSLLTLTPSEYEAGASDNYSAFWPRNPPENRKRSKGWIDPEELARVANEAKFSDHESLSWAKEAKWDRMCSH